MNFLTASRMKTFQTCPRAHFYRYELGMRPVGPEPKALSLGTAIHHGLEAWWTAWMLAGGFDALRCAMAAFLAAMESAADADPFEIARGEAMLAAYDTAWSRDTAGIEVLGVELAFNRPLVNPANGQQADTWMLAGKIDALAQLCDGRVAIVEHKTRTGDASAGSDYRRALTLDPQISLYFHGVQSLSVEADTCLYDILRKPTQKPAVATPPEDLEYTKEKSRACRECSKKNAVIPPPHIDPEIGAICVDGRIITEAPRLKASQRLVAETVEEYRARLTDVIAAAPESFLLRAEIVRPGDEADGHLWNAWHTVRAIEGHRAAVRQTGSVRAVPQHPGACFSHGSPCAYLPICEGIARADDDTQYRRLPVIQPELPVEWQAPNANNTTPAT